MVVRPGGKSVETRIGGHTLNTVLVHGKTPEYLAARYPVEMGRCAVVAGLESKTSAVGRPPGSRHEPRTGKRGQGLTGERVPDAGGEVGAGGGHPATIRAEGHVVERVAVAAKHD